MIDHRYLKITAWLVEIIPYIWMHLNHNCTSNSQEITQANLSTILTVTCTIIYNYTQTHDIAY